MNFNGGQHNGGSKGNNGGSGFDINYQRWQYGVHERQNEDCEVLVKQFINEKLEIPQAGNLSFDRVHRMGPPAHGKVRPIVEKFHYYKEREAMGNKSFELADKLKAVKVGVGAQWP